MKLSKSACCSTSVAGVAELLLGVVAPDWDVFGLSGEFAWLVEMSSALEERDEASDTDRAGVNGEAVGASFRVAIGLAAGEKLLASLRVYEMELCRLDFFRAARSLCAGVSPEDPAPKSTEPPWLEPQEER